MKNSFFPFISQHRPLHSQKKFSKYEKYWQLPLTNCPPQSRPDIHQATKNKLKSSFSEMFSSQRAKIIFLFSSAFLVVPQCGICLFLIQLLMCVKTCFKHRFGKMATNKIVFCAKDCCASRPCSVSNGASNAKCSPPHSFCAATFRFLFIFQI